MTIFIRVLDEDPKDAAIAEALENIIGHKQDHRVFQVVLESFRLVPGAPFAYWVSDSVRRLYAKLPPLETSGRAVKQGLATAYDFRFLRLAWEVPIENAAGDEQKEDKHWWLFAKGGAYSPFYADVHLVVNWGHGGAEIKNNLNDRGKIRSNVWMLKDTERLYFFRPGLTWPLRTTSGLSVRVMPRGCIFGHKGPAVYIQKDDSKALLGLLAVMNSASFMGLLSLQLAAADAAARSYEVGLIQKTPVPEINLADRRLLEQAAFKGWALRRRADTAVETSRVFTLPALLQCAGATLVIRAQEWNELIVSWDRELLEIQTYIDACCFNQYGMSDEDRVSILQHETGRYDEPIVDDQDDGEVGATIDLTKLIPSFISWVLGVSLGRFDIRFALDKGILTVNQDPFGTLPICQPGMLVGADGLMATPDNIVSEEWLRKRAGGSMNYEDGKWVIPEGDDSLPTARCTLSTDSAYPIRISWPGILVDDENHPEDIIRRVREVIDVIWGKQSESIEQEACAILGIKSLRDYFRSPSVFFQEHLKRYSKSRRKAPIYWQLSTTSGSYTLWIYYHQLTDQTLYLCITDYVNPKLDDIRKDIERLQTEIAKGGTASQRNDLEKLIDFEHELKDLRDELLRVAKLPYEPNLNDGVMITSAPLWKIFRQTSWRKELEECWGKLEAGEYDWAHIAYSIWPERVTEKCKIDKSIAIAHDLEHIYEEKTDELKKRRRASKNKGDAS